MTAHNMIMSQIAEVFHDVFDDDDLAVTETTSARDIPDWDSFMNITLALALEEKFNITLNAVEMGAFANVGELAGAITERMNQKTS